MSDHEDQAVVVERESSRDPSREAHVTDTVGEQDHDGTSLYTVEIDLSNANTSHTQMVRMVGHGKRVLDVGCWSGDLGVVLAERGCSVVGIEIDARAAEIARDRLDQVIVGDIESLDLEKELENRRFDVIVFGDVLEHLHDPLATLSRARHFLVPGGYVVASLPNITHAAVRLALLDGRFEYTDTGLLDSTHVRFFTRDSVYELFRNAGLAVAKLVRTTAGPFDTEIQIDRDAVDPSTLERVMEDQDASTYQFVMKAVADDDTRVVATLREQVDAETGRAANTRRELTVLCREIEQLSVDLGFVGSNRDRSSTPADVCKVAVLGELDRDDAAEVWRGQVAIRELRRRLPDASVRTLAPFGVERPARTDPALVLEPLGEWSEERLRELVDEFDAVVSLGEISIGEGRIARRYEVEAHDLRDRSPASFFLVGFGQELEPYCPFICISAPVVLPQDPEDADIFRRVLQHRDLLGVREQQAAEVLTDLGIRGVRLVPDPLVLTPRLYPPEVTASRLASIRTCDWYPNDGPTVVVVVDESLEDESTRAGLVEQFRSIRDSCGTIVFLPASDEPASAAVADELAHRLPGSFRVPFGIPLEDLITVFARAQVLVSTVADPLIIGYAYGRTVVGLAPSDTTSIRGYVELAGPSAAVVKEIDGLHEACLAALKTPTEQSRLRELRRQIDEFLDAVAASTFASHERAQDRVHDVSLDEARRRLEMLRSWSESARLATGRRNEQMTAERSRLRNAYEHLRDESEERIKGLETKLAELEVLRTGELEALNATLHEAATQRDLLTQELTAIRSTKAWRLLAKPRAAYGRVRRLLS